MPAVSRAQRGRRRRHVSRLLAYSLLGAAVYLGCSEWAVRRAAAGRVYERLDEIPPADVALVLGCSKSLADGRANYFYATRLDAAAELFRTGRVRGIIASGDNSRSDYSEPDDMKADLAARGVPERFIACDYAGLRTLDSVQRVSRVFGQRSVIVVSQRAHVERAIFLAQADGIEMTGCVATSAPRWWQVRLRLREVLARGAAVLDVALGRGPKYLGPREAVQLAGTD